MKMRLPGIGIALIGAAVAVGCVTTSYQPARSAPAAQVSVSIRSNPKVDMFYDDLAPYGRWVEVDGPGPVWVPYHVAADWRPYQLGHWVYTDYGWTWASDEDWGWAVYHYGRWNFDASYGWVWAPGSEWGPAWVAWHEGGG